MQVFRMFWIIACLAMMRVLSGNTITQVPDLTIGTQNAAAFQVATENNSFFTSNRMTIGVGGSSSIVGWFYNPAAIPSLIEVQDPTIGTQQATPTLLARSGTNIFFVTNGDVIGNGGFSDLVGWTYNPATLMLTPVHDTHLGTMQTAPFNVLAAPNNTFLITNGGIIGQGALSDLVGWLYDPATTMLTEVLDPALGTQQAEPFLGAAVATNNTFFIANIRSIGAGGTGSIVGWFYNPAISLTTATEVQDATLGTQGANALNVAVAANNTFFITNNGDIGGLSGGNDIVGWLYNPMTPALTTVHDTSLVTQFAQPANIAVIGNTFFITNQQTIGSGGTGNVVGWSYDSNSLMLTQVPDLSLGTQQATPLNVVAVGSDFFIANSEGISSSGPSNIVGWLYNPAMNILTEVKDPSLGTQFPNPFNVVAAGNNTLFITDNTLIGSGGGTNIVGWFYNPATSISTATNVQDPNLGTQQAEPFNVVAAGNNTFFIANQEPINSGTSNIVGWFYDPATSTLFEAQDSALGTQDAMPLNLVAAANNTFFIANDAEFGTLNSNIVGWYFIPSFAPNTLPPSSIEGFSKRNRFLTQTDHFNLIKWSAPSGLTPSGYEIFRDAALTDLIATLPNDVFEYIDHNRMPKHLYSYFVVAVFNGSLSSPLEITIYVP